MPGSISYLHLSFFLSLVGSPDAGRLPVEPSAQNLTLTREPEGESFYQRDKLSGPLSFAGAAYRFLFALESSRQRCQPVLLTLECRPAAGAAVAYTWRGTFTCNEVSWDPDGCTCNVTPVPADGYTALLESWERPVNLLGTSATRRTVSAQLVSLPTGANLEFLRTDTDGESDYIGTDGWVVFLRNTSFIGGGHREKQVLLFRYVQNGVPQVFNPDTNQYEAQDLSSSGWNLYTPHPETNPPTADYVKEPEISGFKFYQIGTFNDWWHTEGGRRPRYDTSLLLLPCGARPSQYGFLDADYVQVSGPGGANNSEGTGQCLNLRRNLRNNNFKSLWWKFGSFSFTRCFPLLDGLYHVLGKTAPELLPPSADRLSDLLSSPVNPVTGEVSTDNELPGLLISAGSDVKRYGASEPATRLLVSLRELVTDLCTLYDAGWLIDPETGWFRLEHRSYFEAQDAAVLDLTPAGPYATTAIVPGGYTYRSETLPQFEQLQVANALTEDYGTGLSFGRGEIEYTGACVNTRQGQNTTTRSVQRLTGDVAALVLSGGALPDSAIAVLSPGLNGRLLNGNRGLAASELLRRYHVFGRVRPTGQVNGVYQVFASTRLSREQKGVSVPLCSLDLLPPTARVHTLLSERARSVKAVLNLTSGVVELTLLHPAPESDAEGPVLRRQFDGSFDLSFA